VIAVPDARVHVDFNGVEDDGRVAALRSHADTPEALDPGVVVTLFDEDGNTALGRVAEIGERDLVWITVLWDSWNSHGIVVEGDAEQPAPLTMAPGTARHTVWPYWLRSAGAHDRPDNLLVLCQIDLVDTGEPAMSAR
jgi:hypothetical protein